LKINAIENVADKTRHVHIKDAVDIRCCLNVGN
jgi:sugar phosphate isomerase/epimerase